MKRHSSIGLFHRRIRLDVTPLVDIAFLLLVFFVLILTMKNDNVMSLYLPAPVGCGCYDYYDGCGVGIDEGKVVTFVLGKQNKVYWWQGVMGEVNETDYSAEGLRTVIDRHLYDREPLCTDEKTKSAIARGEMSYRQCWDPIFIIKPTKFCRYKNVVDALDEMNILSVKKYSIAPFTSNDSLLLAKNEIRH